MFSKFHQFIEIWLNFCRSFEWNHVTNMESVFYFGGNILSMQMCTLLLDWWVWMKVFLLSSSCENLGSDMNSSWPQLLLCEEENLLQTLSKPPGAECLTLKDRRDWKTTLGLILHENHLKQTRATSCSVLYWNTDNQQLLWPHKHKACVCVCVCVWRLSMCLNLNWAQKCFHSLTDYLLTCVSSTDPEDLMVFSHFSWFHHEVKLSSWSITELLLSPLHYQTFTNPFRAAALTVCRASLLTADISLQKQTGEKTWKLILSYPPSSSSNLHHLTPVSHCFFLLPSSTCITHSLSHPPHTHPTLRLLIRAVPKRIQQVQTDWSDLRCRLHESKWGEMFVEILRDFKKAENQNWDSLVSHFTQTSWHLSCHMCNCTHTHISSEQPACWNKCTSGADSSAASTCWCTTLLLCWEETLYWSCQLDHQPLRLLSSLCHTLLLYMKTAVRSAPLSTHFI